MVKTKKNDNKNWESICERCGRCCYEKIDFDGRIYYTDLPCEFLEIESNHCRVYAERDTARPGCVRLNPEKVAKGFLPADCPYVRDLKGYVAPIMPDEDEGDA